MSDDLGFIPDAHAAVGFIADAPTAPQKAQGFVQGLTTNQPTQGFGAYMGRNAPRMIGGMVGATAGAGAMSIPTAALGGSAGEAARQALVSGMGNSTGTGDVLKNVGAAGAEQGIGQGAVLGAGAAINAAAPAIMETFPRIPTRYGQAALEGASTGDSAIQQAKGQDAVSAAYQAFERYTGLQGITQQEVATQHLPSVNEMTAHVFKIGQDVVAGKAVDPQELYTASQYASRLKMMSRIANPPPELLGRSGAIAQGKDLIDGALGDIYPEYASLRADAFKQKAADFFSSILPRNNNQSVSKLGVTAAAGLSYEGVKKMSGSDDAGIAAAAIPLLAMSPFAYGAAIQAAPVAAAGIRAGVGQAADALGDYWRKFQAQKPQNPASPLAPR